MIRMDNSIGQKKQKKQKKKRLIHNSSKGGDADLEISYYSISMFKIMTSERDSDLCRTCLNCMIFILP